jgi:hypothetical protein
MSDTRWDCQIIKLTQDSALASSKTHKSIFFISGLPEIVYQGTHISGGYKDTICCLLVDDRQMVN